MKVYIERENVTKEIVIKKTMMLKDLLKELNISIESVILQKNGKIALEDTQVCNEDELRILSVVSGG